jgi:hypothetical protein
MSREALVGVSIWARSLEQGDLNVYPFLWARELIKAEIQRASCGRFHRPDDALTPVERDVVHSEAVWMGSSSHVQL